MLSLDYLNIPVCIFINMMYQFILPLSCWIICDYFWFVIRYQSYLSMGNEAQENVFSFAPSCFQIKGPILHSLMRVVRAYYWHWCCKGAINAGSKLLLSALATQRWRQGAGEWWVSLLAAAHHFWAGGKGRREGTGRTVSDLHHQILISMLGRMAWYINPQVCTS